MTLTQVMNDLDPLLVPAAGRVMDGVPRDVATQQTS